MERWAGARAWVTSQLLVIWKLLKHSNYLKINFENKFQASNVAQTTRLSLSVITTMWKRTTSQQFIDFPLSKQPSEAEFFHAPSSTERIFLFAHSIRLALILSRLLRNWFGLEFISTSHFARRVKLQWNKFFQSFSEFINERSVASLFSSVFCVFSSLLFTPAEKKFLWQPSEGFSYLTITIETKRRLFPFIKSNSYSSPASRRKREKALVEN